MAKQLGHLPLTGTIGGVNYYISEGQALSRAAGGGFTREAIKKSARMERVRENNTEFGDAARTQKIFKDSLSPFFGNQKDRQLHTQMKQLFLKLKDCDGTSVRGQRQVGIGLQTLEGRELLSRFDFAHYPLLFRNGVYDANTFTYTVATLDSNELSYRNGATHVELRLGIVVMDFDALKASLFASEPLLIAKAAPLPDLSLAPSSAPTGTGMRITVLWHSYLQEVNGTFYPLKDKAVYGLRVVGITD